MLRLSKREVSRLLDLTGKMVAGKSTKRIFECMVLEWGETGARVWATDLEHGIEVDLPRFLSITGEGRVCVPYTSLARLRRFKPKDGFTFDQEEGNLRVSWRTGVKATRLLECEDVSQYPEKPKAAKLTTVDGLGQALEESKSAVGHEAARFVLNAVQVRDGALNSCDGRRAYQWRHGALTGDTLFNLPRIPAKYLKTIRSYGIGTREAQFRGEDFRVYCRKVDGTFPPLEQIIPWSYEAHPIDCLAWIEAIESVEDLCSVESGSIVLSASRGNVLFVAAGGDGRAEALVPCDMEFNRIGLNPSFVKDFLKLNPERFGCGGSSHPVLFEDSQRSMVLMPVLTGD